MGQDFKGYSCLLVDLSVNVIGSRITREVNKGTALGATEVLIRSWGSYQSMLGFLVEVVRWWHYWEVVKRKAWYLARRSNHWDFMPMGAVSCPAISLYSLHFLFARSWKAYSTMIPLPWCPTQLYGANNQACPISGSSQQYSIVPGILWLGSCLMPSSHSSWAPQPIPPCRKRNCCICAFIHAICSGSGPNPSLRFHLLWL